MVQFLENKKMIFHFMDVDYFLLLLLKKLIFFSKTSKKWRAPGSRQVFQIRIKNFFSQKNLIHINHSSLNAGVTVILKKFLATFLAPGLIRDAAIAVY